jgi:IMP cyclohydrolase
MDAREIFNGYPGRWGLIGLSDDVRPSAGYIVTGRSPESQQRKATIYDGMNSSFVHIGPIIETKPDPLRHYDSIRADNDGRLVVTNGNQTQDMYKSYKMARIPGKLFLKAVLGSWKVEPDSLKTPRIAGIITDYDEAETICPVYDAEGASSFRVKPEPGTMQGFPTYLGDVKNVTPFPFHQLQKQVPSIRLKWDSARDLAYTLFNITNPDLIVCSVGAVWYEEDGKWNIFALNKREK